MDLVHHSFSTLQQGHHREMVHRKNVAAPGISTWHPRCHTLLSTCLPASAVGARRAHSILQMIQSLFREHVPVEDPILL